ncbi:SAM-dependent methyltransferase [Mesorhizobium sp. M1C.F.Ca.ET.193.01.1.1]|uniref:HsdM family class I SAM-dependent methyltransferase n=1 Tax=unclassified Mesorhizobium TaxID=325217 RepID=UPI000FD3E640|nr:MULTISPECIES: N-6 DNA methylase [unclassified Mesorhizobium]TGS91385.1 SAM-dependent methyltransferase [bacterium M00.F.Ca.ET.177.01.1.1]TGQ51534.1 SAM-dependent methyltransferase [Mesorhizobium sp. M1C.F.Ca.ET.210.01.1.1]TGQ67762.1 SAM-dependent methyltransferase [Mesorhizobium sp. M1C.F.Ca.ET.212.01.1.1]TGR02355.1 SAM-dependent methyltransferase [Mesorhizobium sp. M1C.F.Ca.ET.204.01.1.1]TGR22897.1 SAM-dependent methyltransferase [Mesorhizobium sp. M1C.F.Ca.ET.196.01.1.1]
MTAPILRKVLEATGYVADGIPAQGVLIDDDARRGRRGRFFEPDALWRGQSSLTVYFKSAEAEPSDELVASWRQEVWNEGFAPLLWVVSPDRVDLYNGFGRPLPSADAARNRLATFEAIESSLEQLDALAGRLAMETGQFWLKAKGVDRKTAVDQQLLSDLAALEQDLVAADLGRAEAQALIGRSIFTQYLVDRDIVTADRFESLCGHAKLSAALRDRKATTDLFAWLTRTFNGDMFPPSAAAPPDAVHLARVADFLEAVDPDMGQMTFFPYQFDVIPVELISSIYEQFAHSGSTPVDGRPRSTEASRAGVYYTRLPVVSLVLDEVMDGLTGDESVLDLTCGSGVFLVEAFRRLVHLKGLKSPVTRQLIRQVLYSQVYGVDVSEAAIRVAAFSLYLAALEIDPDPQPPEALTFKPLIDRTLFVGDAHTIEQTEAGAKALTAGDELKRFDLIVGNPPWSFRGKAGTANRRSAGAPSPPQPRGEGLDFVLRAAEFAHEQSRFGMVLSAMPFFSGSKTGAEASRHVVKALSPVTLVNLSNLSSWLFPAAKMPAVALFARHRPQAADRITVVQVPWSPSGAKSHTFEITPSDIIQLPLSDWERQPVRLKTAAFGRRRDLRLLDDLMCSHPSLGERLGALGTVLKDGLILGHAENRTRDARELAPLEFLQVDDLRPFSVPEKLTIFGHTKAQWPRDRDLYKAPLLLVKEFLTEGPRPLAAVADRDLVFSDAYFGAPIPAEHRDAGHVMAGVLSSALASWFFIMTASEFGLWKQRLFRQDVALLPTPDLTTAASSAPGRAIRKLEQRFQQHAPTAADWEALDQAVFDLYGLDADDRIVVRDGLFRASWEWRPGRLSSVEPAASRADVLAYAQTFADVMDRWLSARRRRRMRAEVFDLSNSEALRVVRFALEDEPGPSIVEVVEPRGDLIKVLARIGNRLGVPLATSVTGQRELRVHGPGEVVVIKPAARRHWMESVALEDVDSVIAESFTGPSA